METNKTFTISSGNAAGLKVKYSGLGADATVSTFGRGHWLEPFVVFTGVLFQCNWLIQIL